MSTGKSGKQRSENAASAGPTEAKHCEKTGAVEKLLIVEDHPRLRNALHMYFENCGFVVASAADFTSAVEKARQLSPDVVICDWQIEGPRSGADVARTLQRSFCSAVIFVTGASVEELRRETSDLSVARYFEKPLDAGELELAIRSLR